MNTATKDHPASGLRLSDADRDRAAAELSEHFEAGRLTADEFDERLGRALQARSAADLAPLFADLPRKQPPMTAPASGQAASGPVAPATFSCARVPVVPIAILAVVALGALFSGHPGLFILVPVVILLIARRLTGHPGHPGRRAPK